MFNKLKIGTKLIGGFAIVLILTLVIGGVSILRLNQINATVTTLSENYANNRQLANDIVNKVWEERFYASHFINDQEQDDLDGFQQANDALHATLTQAAIQITDPQRAAQIAQIQAVDQGYEAAFNQVHDLILAREKVINEALEVQGPLADSSLQTLREMALNSDGAAQAYFINAGNAQRAFLQERLYIFKYLQDGDEQWLPQIDEFHQEAQAAFLKLDKELQDSERRALLTQARNAEETYYAAFTSLQAGYAQQNQLVYTKMYGFGSEMTDTAMQVSNDIGLDYQAATAATASLVSQTGTIVLVATLFALIFSLGLSISITRSIQRPLKGMLTQMLALTSGGGDLTLRLPATARDEIGDLARAFNAFLESLGNIMRSISEGALKLASSTNQISASTNEMAAGAESQNQQTARTSSSMEEITAAFQEVSRNTSSTADAARAAVTRAQQGTTRVQNTLAELSQSNAAFQQLRKRSAEIGELVSLIANIASQTNILALNAAIEAAGAGAAGLRFDVVAEEIRKLAQRTTESTARITTTVDDIQKDIQTAAELMERSSVQAQEAEQSLVDIVEGIASVNDMVGVVATATEQQVKAAGQVAEALQLIAQVTQQTAQAAQESARSSNDLAGLAQSLRETSGKFKV